MNFKYIVIVSCSLVLSSCTKWLDVQPKTQISETDLFVDEKGFKDALTGVYVQMSSDGMYARELTMASMDVFAQQYDVSSTIHRYYEFGKYNYTNQLVESTINQFWNAGYKAIANVNNLLAAIDAKKDVFTEGSYELVKGEALGLRAFLHFDLFRLYGPIPSKGLGEETIPYLKEFKMDVGPNLPGKNVLDACMVDLNAAIELLKDHQSVHYGAADPFESHTRNHFNYWAAHGLKARIALYRGDKETAYASAKKVIDNAALFPFVKRNDLVGSAPSRIFLSELLFCIYTPTLKNINERLFKKVAEGNVLTNTKSFTEELFEGSTSDFRGNFLWKTDGSTDELYPAKYRVDDIQTNFLNTRRVPLLRLSEMFYIASEATPNVIEKIELLNNVLSNRGVDDLSSNLTDAEVENELFKEYRKEFYQEGQLFFYYKRKNITRIAGGGLDMTDAQYILPRPKDEIEFTP